MPARKAVFQTTELLEAALLELPAGQARTLHDARHAFNSISANIEDSSKLQRRLFLQAEPTHHHYWPLNDTTHTITYVGPGGAPMPQLTPNVRVVRPYIFNASFFSGYRSGPLFANTQNPTLPLSGTLSVNDMVHFLREDSRSLESLVVQPPRRSALLLNEHGYSVIGNPRGLTLEDVHDVMKNVDPDARCSWGLWVQDAVFAPQSMINQIRNEGAMVIHSSLGELLDDSTTRLTPNLHRYNAQELRNQIYQHLGPADLLRLQQASKAMRKTVLDSKAARENLVLESKHPETHTILEIAHANDPICFRLSQDVSQSEDLVGQLCEVLDHANNGGRKFILKSAAVINKIALTMPEPDMFQQAEKGHVDLVFSIPDGVLNDDASILDMLITSPPVTTADVFGTRYNLYLQKPRTQVTFRDILDDPRRWLPYAPQIIQTVRLKGKIFVKEVTWNEIQDKPELTPEDVHKWWKEAMADL